SLFAEALEIFRKALPVGHSSTTDATWALGRVLLDEGKFAEAEPLIREVVAIRRQTLGPKAAPTTQAARGLAELLIKTNRLDEAAALRKEYGLPDPTTRPS